MKGALALVNPDGDKKNQDEEQKKRRAIPTTKRMRELLTTDGTKAVYRQRKTIGEPAFGQIKHARGTAAESAADGSGISFRQAGCLMAKSLDVEFEFESQSDRHLAVMATRQPSALGSFTRF